MNFNLPLLRFFKKSRPNEGGTAVISQPIVAIEKPASERFGKTVMPNVTRIVGVEAAPDLSLPMSAAVAPDLPSISSASLFATSQTVAPIPAPAPAPRKISLGAKSDLAAGPKPLAPELTAPPAAERTITLQLADVAPNLPAGLLKSGPVDPFQRLILKTASLERGMSSGRPTVPLRAIYQQAPEFFVSAVDPADETEVPLPFAKVLEQFTAFQVRPDQIAEQALPQVETPFLQVTLEDSERFGMPVTPIAPPAPAPAPEPVPTPVAEIQPTAPIRLPVPQEAGAAAVSSAQPEQPPASPSIPVRISPNGTGVPATERVPASSGSPVPTPLPSPFAPARIPFKIGPPSDDLRDSAAPKVQSLRIPIGKVESSASIPLIRLPLRTILRGLAPFQLSGPIDDVAESAMIELPFSIIAPQLSLGRISITPAQFQAALPEEYRATLKIEDPETPIGLPLQEVLQNLPNESLQLRGDQEETEVVSFFETPFSQKAAEDATRLKNLSGPIAQPVVTSDAVKPVTAAVSAAHAPTPAPVVPVPRLAATEAPPKTPPATPAAPAGRSALQVAFDTDETLDPKGVVARVRRLPGVSACAIVFSDGLSLAGDIPAEYGVDALCAIAPSILKKIGEQIGGANLGSLAGVTLFCAKAAVTFFGHGNICLAALHQSGEEIASEIRDRLNRVAEALAQTYAQPVEKISPNDA